MFRDAFLVVFLFVVTMEVWFTDSYAQTSVTLDPIKDNTLYEAPTGILSNGIGEYVFVGKTAGAVIRRALVAFDIAGSVPAGATIDSVRLTLNFSRTIAEAQTVYLHRVLADWGEGTSDAGGEEGGGALSTTNDATWIHTFWNTGFWADSGGDFSATVSASRTIGDNTTYGHYTWGPTAEMVADVQSWLDDPSGNFGWMLRGNENDIRTTKRFDSRENLTAANRPVLTVYYSEGGVPCSAITSFQARCIGGTTFTLQFRVNLLNSTIYAGETVTFDVDGTQYVRTIFTNGTHSRASHELTGVAAGSHTISVLDPPDCFAPAVVTCRAGSYEDPSWNELDALWAASSQSATTELKGNYPNPFNPATTIYYSLSRDSRVSLKIFNTIGQEVATLVNDFQAAGERSVVWNGKSSSGNDVAAGVYLIVLRSGDIVNVNKVLLLK